MKNQDTTSRVMSCLLQMLVWMWNHPRTKYFRKILYNFKLTVLCGIITLLVFRGTVGAGKLGSVQEDIQIVHTGLRNFQQDRLLQSHDSQQLLWEESRTSSGPYSIGPVIKDWDEVRARWVAADPGCNETGDGKPLVMIVSGSQPTPCEHNVGDHLLTKFLKTKLDYARVKKMRVYYHMVRLDKEMTGLWAKLPLLRRLMVANPDVEWFWWIDPDAAITDMKFEMPWKKYDKYSMIVPGWEELVYKEKDWVGLSTGSFLLRNTQWSLDLLEAWSKMGVRGKPRDDAGKLLTQSLKGRPSIPADDQSALVYLMVNEKNRWGDNIHLENKYYLHGYWVNLVDRFEKMMEKYKPGYGDERWPFLIHFVGCQLCGAAGDYDVQRCITQMARAFNFADNQVVKPYGYKHLRLNSSILLPTNETTRVKIVETHFERKKQQKAMKSAAKAVTDVGSVSDDNAARDLLPAASESLVEELVSGGVLARTGEAGKGIASLTVVPGGKGKKVGQSVAWASGPGQSAADWRDNLEGVDEQELQEKKLEEAESKLMHQIEGKHLAEEEAEEEAQAKQEEGSTGASKEESAIDRLKDEMVKETGSAEGTVKAGTGKSAIELGGETSSEEDVGSGEDTEDTAKKVVEGQTVEPLEPLQKSDEEQADESDKASKAGTSGDALSEEETSGKVDTEVRGVVGAEMGTTTKQDDTSAESEDAESSTSGLKATEPEADPESAAEVGESETSVTTKSNPEKDAPKDLSVADDSAEEKDNTDED